MNIDTALGGIKRPFTRKEGAQHFGPTGRRLWATYLDPVPGLSGVFDYIHKTNIPGLFTLRIAVDGKPIAFREIASTWYPSHTNTVFAADVLRLREVKFITDDDCAVDVITITNASSHPVKLELQPDWSIGSSYTYERRGTVVYLRGALSGSQQRVLGAGERSTWTVGMAFGLSEAEAEGTLSRWLNSLDPAAKHVTRYQSWFDQCPQFTCSNKRLEKLWAYRWYLLRRNIAQPDHGRLRHPVVYEGRGFKMTFKPWHPGGWEFSKLIPFSTPFHLLEGRWHPDVSACRGSVLALVENQREDGLFPYVYTNEADGFYTNFLAWAVWQFHLVRPDREWLAAVAPGLQKELDGTLKLFDPDQDGLPEVIHHGRTGKEYQPSFFHRAGYPKEPKKESQDVAPIERVDYACYVQMNASALAAIWAELGNPVEAQRCMGIAAQSRASILSTMWDKRDAFFYDVDASTHGRIPVKQVVGYDPFLAGVAGVDHIEAFRYLADPKAFGLPHPVPSVERSNPAYAPNASWFGVHLKGEHGAMWNGPTWPFTNSTVLMALANTSRLSRHWLDPLYSDLFLKTSDLAFAPGEPNIFEHYNPETGQPISEEADYLHSSWIDLVVSHVAGMIPTNDSAKIDPIDCSLEYSLTGIPYRGELLNFGS